jgi:hypothetical protein
MASFGPDTHFITWGNRFLMAASVLEKLILPVYDPLSAHPCFP